jgi:hypothetical protein
MVRLGSVVFGFFGGIVKLRYVPSRHFPINTTPHLNHYHNTFPSIPNRVIQSSPPSPLLALELTRMNCNVHSLWYARQMRIKLGSNYHYSNVNLWLERCTMDHRGVPIADHIVTCRRMCPRFNVLITVVEAVKWSGKKLTFIQDTCELR